MDTTWLVAAFGAVGTLVATLAAYWKLRLIRLQVDHEKLKIEHTRLLGDIRDKASIEIVSVEAIDSRTLVLRGSAYPNEFVVLTWHSSTGGGGRFWRSSLRRKVLNGSWDATIRNLTPGTSSREIMALLCTSEAFENLANRIGDLPANVTQSSELLGQLSDLTLASSALYAAPTPDAQLVVVETLDCKGIASDPPTGGWRIKVERGKPPLRACHTDGFVGEHVIITQAEDSSYACDINVPEQACHVSSVRIVTAMERGAKIYARLRVRSRGGNASRTVWLAFAPGPGKPKRFGTGQNEWHYFPSGEDQGGGWESFLIDLKPAVAQSFGQDGWELESIEGIRLRGSLKLAKIDLVDKK